MKERITFNEEQSKLLLELKKKLHSAMLAEDITQTALASATGTSVQTINAYTRHSTLKGGSLMLYVILADLLGYEVILCKTKRVSPIFNSPEIKKLIDKYNFKLTNGNRRRRGEPENTGGIKIKTAKGKSFCSRKDILGDM